MAVARIMNMQDPDRFEGAAFHPQFPKGRTSGTLIVQATRLTFRWDGGEVEMPLSGASLEMGGASNRLVFFKNPALADWSFYTSDASILNHAHLQDYPELNAQAGRHRRRRHGVRAGYLAFAAIVIGLVVGVIAARHWMVSALAAQVPASWEKELGDQAMAQYRLGATVLESPALNEQFAILTDALLEPQPEQRHKYRFHIVQDASLNAMAFPGGNVVVHTGLLRAAENEAQILGVLAHEIAHVEYRHSLRNVINSLGLIVLIKAFLGDSTVFYGVLVQAVPYLLRQDFSRDMERDADAKGVEYLQRANIDPRGMAGMFSVMRDHYGAMGETMDNLTFLSSHPSLTERIETLNTQLAGSDGQAFREFDGTLAKLIAELDNLQGTREEEGQDEN